MVEIKSNSQDVLAASSTSEDSLNDIKYRLVYSKSKVYVNTTAYARDNIPGFVALVKRVSVSPVMTLMRLMFHVQEAVNPSYLLAWIPETLLNEKGQGEWEKFVKIEEKTLLHDDEDDGEYLQCTLKFLELK